MTYYEERFRESLEFQDFVAIELHKIGISINCFGSKKYQTEYGESIAGVEIKFDKKMEETGNAYFEYQEKTNEANEFYVNSGILRNDNTIFYAIGNYKKLLIVPKNSLKRLYELVVKTGKYNSDSDDVSEWGIKHNVRVVMTPTSKGIVIPIETLNQCGYIAHLIDFKEDNSK